VAARPRLIAVGDPASRSAARERAAIALLILAWGATFAAVKIGLESSPPVLFAGLRSLIGGALMAVLAWSRTGMPRLAGHGREYTLLTVLNVLLFFGLQTAAIALLPSGLAAVLIYLQPVLVGVLAWWLLDEPMTTAKILGLVLGFAGIVVVGGGAFAGHVSAAGVGLAVASALAWALGTIVFKATDGRVDAWWAVALPFLVGGALLTVVGLVVEGPDITWSPRFVAALAFAGFVGTALAWALWFGLVAAGEAGRAASYIFFVPLVGVVVGAVLLDETLTVSLLVGAALVVLGVYLVNRRPRDTRTPTDPSLDPDQT
jgi:drug/metabolite transporter (DMT)-like permease